MEGKAWGGRRSLKIYWRIYLTPANVLRKVNNDYTKKSFSLNTFTLILRRVASWTVLQKAPSSTEHWSSLKVPHSFPLWDIWSEIMLGKYMCLKDSLIKSQIREKVPKRSRPYYKPFKSWIPWDLGRGWRGRGDKADPYQLIKKNEITVDKRERGVEKLKEL